MLLQVQDGSERMLSGFGSQAGHKRYAALNIVSGHARQREERSFETNQDPSYMAPVEGVRMAFAVQQTASTSLLHVLVSRSV